jgi:hypothetical protein
MLKQTAQQALGKRQRTMTGAKRASMLRDHSAAVRVTNIELFFDLVYIFTITEKEPESLCFQAGDEWFPRLTST